MNKIIFYLEALVLICTNAYAQNELDAYRFAQADINGSARAVSMGGAFGALGADMTAMSNNPAGLAVYRSSEIAGTVNLHNAQTKANWTNVNNKANNTLFGLDNFAYVGHFPTHNYSGIMSWNFAVAYNQTKNFNRKVKAIGNPTNSLGDYIAHQASNAFGEQGGIYLDELNVDGSYDPYYNTDLAGNWLSILGYETGFIAPNEDNADNDQYHNAFQKKPQETTLNYTEKGSVSEYNFALATNINDRIFIGATLGVTDVDYSLTALHYETFSDDDYGFIANDLETEGTAYSVNVGVIARPIDALRFGIAYNSPRWFHLTDYFYAEGVTNITSYDPPLLQSTTPVGQYAEYKLQTPEKWIFSAAAIIGTQALISVDYELVNFKTMQLANTNDDPYEGDNELIHSDFDYRHTIRAGAELKVTPRFAVRAGYVWQPTPMTKDFRNGEEEVFPAGTITHYTLDKTNNTYTAGLGYRFTPNFYVDLAYILNTQTEKLYTFPNVKDAVKSTPAELTVNNTRIAMTFGYKF